MPDYKKTFQIKAGQDQTIDIHIDELAGVKAENLGLKTWGAAWILSNSIAYLQKYAISGDNPLNVLEIGAGTGLSGIAAALLWRCNAIITDLPTIVPGMVANVTLNEIEAKQRQASIRCGTLDWFHPKQFYIHENGNDSLLTEHNKFQVILAADTLYYDDHPRLQADTVFQWLARDANACFIVCYAQRIAYLDHIRELWSILEEGGLQSVEEHIEVGDATWDEEAPFEWAVFKWKQFLPSEAST